MIKDLTIGEVKKVLRSFTLPLFISVIFQQLYNIADSVVVGRFIGEDALASVGASYPITILFMAVAWGSDIGCRVIISQLFGAKRYAMTKTAIYTSIISAIGLAVLMSIIGMVFTGNILSLIDTPENIFYSAMIYLRIYIAGFTFVFLYNICNGIFTSLGDSKTPLYFLIASSIINVVLDIVFVVIFKYGVAGAAIATFISQFLVGVVSFIWVLKRIREIDTKEPYEFFSFPLFIKIARVSIPSILQQSCVSVGNVFIQSIINSFGSATIAGYSAAIKLNTFTISCFGTIGGGVSNFTSQNMGAKKFERVEKGFAEGLKLQILIAFFFTCVYAIKPEIVMSIFLEENGAAMQVGRDFLRIVGIAYFIISIKLIADGVLMGAGAMKEFMIATFVDLLSRVVLAFYLSEFFGARGIWLSWPIGWTVGTLISCFYYKNKTWIKNYKEV